MKDEFDFHTLPKRKTIKGIPFKLDAFGSYSPEFRENAPIKLRIRQPSDCLPLLLPIRNEAQEHFILVTLDGANQVIKAHTISKGLVNSCQIHPRETYFHAITDLAVSIIIAHNHPSGNLEASSEDLATTRRLSDVSKTMGIKLLDHLIVSENGFLSLKETYPIYFS